MLLLNRDDSALLDLEVVVYVLLDLHPSVHHWVLLVERHEVRQTHFVVVVLLSNDFLLLKSGAF